MKPPLYHNLLNNSIIEIVFHYYSLSYLYYYFRELKNWINTKVREIKYQKQSDMIMKQFKKYDKYKR